MPHSTPQESVRTIRRRLLSVEAAHPGSSDVEALHETLLKAFRAWGHMLVDPGEVEPLAGGGEPKPPKPPGT